MAPANDTDMLTNLRYEGNGWAEFGNPLLRIKGPTVVETDERGLTIATMQVEEVPTSLSVADGFAMLLGDVFKSMNETGKPCSMEVNTPAGVFRTINRFSRRHNIRPAEVSTQLRCDRAQFVVADLPAKYWRLPILNFHGSLQPAFRLRELKHPLRLSTVAPITPFQIGREIGFLENVANHEELTKCQQNGDRAPHITAALVAPVVGGIGTFSEIKSWFPFGLLNLLGLSSGSRVGAPWIEFFNENGLLVQRTHVHLGTDHYEKGDEFLNDVVHRGGLGRLITCALESSEFGQPYVNVALNHLLLGNRDSQALEDKVSHFSRALDALAEHFGLDVQNLLDGLIEEDKVAVKAILGNARDRIREIGAKRRAAGNAQAFSVLERVAERAAATPACTDRSFGLGVLDLLSRFGLQDSAVADAYYASHSTGGKGWVQLLSHYRGLSQHGGAFGFEDGEHSAVEVFRFANHLGDIVTRILLKLLGYDGQYQERNARWAGGKDLDWVVPETPADEIGFGRND